LNRANKVIGTPGGDSSGKSKRSSMGRVTAVPRVRRSTQESDFLSWVSWGRARGKRPPRVEITVLSHIQNFVFWL